MAKIYEKSSGGVVYKKEGDKVYILILKWLNSRGKMEHVLPKGHIEDGEIAKDTAVREIAEETGLTEENLEVVKFINKLTYTFTASHIKNSPLVHKDVYLFLVKYTGTAEPIVQKEERFIGYEWVPTDRIKYIRAKFNLQTIVKNNSMFFI